MRRPAWLRVFTAVWAIWLQAALLDPGSFDPCPEHSRHAVATAQAAEMHMAHGAHQHGAPGDKHAHTCNCLGACCCAPAVAVPASHIDVPIVATLDQAPAQHDDDGIIAVRRAYSLPFSNGPPGFPALTA